VTALVVAFPRARRAEAAPDTLDFWFPLLEEMSPRQRQATIREAERCGVLDERDAYILATSWPEDREAGDG
jgi:hypothetical protein